MTHMCDMTHTYDMTQRCDMVHICNIIHLHRLDVGSLRRAVVAQAQELLTAGTSIYI